MERAQKREEALALIDSNLGKNLAKYRRTTPEDRSREMQAAAFGEAAQYVDKAQYQELIENVRTMRRWLRKNGRRQNEHPEYAELGHPIFSVCAEDEEARMEMSVELKPWEQHSGKHLENYPKFTLESETQGRRFHFNLNFDDTYYLSITAPNNLRYESVDLPRREMTKFEYAIVKGYMKDAAARFSIPFDTASR